MYQCETVQITEMIMELQGPRHVTQWLDIVSHAAWGGVAFTVNASCAIFLHRTAAGLLNSRFLRHLSTVFALSAANVLMKSIYLLLIPVLAFVVCHAQPDKLQAKSFFSQAEGIVHTTWSIIAVIISFLSTVYMFMAWDILRQYPNEGVRKSLYATLAAFFGGSVLVALINLLTVYEKVENHLSLVVIAIDLVTSATAILLVGWQLLKKLGPKMPEKAALKATVPGMTFIMYFIWGISQLLYWWLQDFLSYSMLLFTSSLGAVIMTIILCSMALEEKRKYRSNKKSG